MPKTIYIPKQKDPRVHRSPNRNPKPGQRSEWVNTDFMFMETEDGDIEQGQIQNGDFTELIKAAIGGTLEIDERSFLMNDKIGRYVMRLPKGQEGGGKYGGTGGEVAAKGGGSGGSGYSAYKGTDP